MMALERILCPIDFSEFSARAAACAGALARHHGARLVLLHVSYVQVPPAAFGAGPGPLLLDERAIKALEEDLRAFAAPHVDASVLTEARVVQGAAAPEILAAATASRADLIVLGTHGRGGFERLMLGSVADKVVRKAVCPVITVPRAAEEASASARFSRIVCATDFSEGSRAALSWALAFAGTPDARLTLVHVLDWPDVPEEGEPFASTLTEARDRWLEQLRRRVHEALPAEARSGVTVEEVLATGTPYKEILQAAAERRADLIVMGVHGRGALDLRLFGSTTSEVLRRAACSVLTVRAAG
jgi:nucleotide-binding universal stress UspA family protein